jgi:hypothetical protein
MANMNHNVTPNYATTEHYLQRVLVGNVKDVRHRLYDVLEMLDYDFIDESESGIEARRGVRGWANAYASADVLDYPRVLIIKLKPLSETSTRASFAYNIKHPSLNRGETDVLTREAETIATLATVRTMDRICAVCGTESDNDSRFCRRCGTPMSGDQTAIEVLRMTAEIRSGHTSVVTSAIMALLTTVMILIALVLSGVAGEGINLLLIIAAVISFLNIFVIGFGWKRLNNALKSKTENQKSISTTGSKNFPDNFEAMSLSPRPVSFSVTDGTTELIGIDEKQPEFIRRKKATTNELK